MIALMFFTVGVLQLVEKPVPRPDDEEVLIRVEACGLCRSDSLLVNGVIKGIRIVRFCCKESSILKFVGFQASLIPVLLATKWLASSLRGVQTFELNGD